MRRIVFFLSVLALANLGCATSVEEKTLAIVNTGVVDAELVESVRTFVQKQLHVPVRSEENTALADKSDFQTLEKAAVAHKGAHDITYIVLAELEGSEHLQVYPQTGVAIVNTKALHTDDNKKFTLRVERMVMRAAAFCFELPPTPDPYCVTRDYRSLDDLDRMGRNYSPPWQARYAQEAAKRGLKQIQPQRPEILGR